MGAKSRSFGYAQSGAFVGDGLDSLLFVELRPACFEDAGNGRLGHAGLADDGGERAPFFAKGIFLHARGHAHALRFHFRLEDFGFIGLAGVEKTALRFGCVAGDVREIAARVKQLLRRENAKEGHFHGAGDADALLFGFYDGELRLLAEDFLTQAQLAAGHDGLLHEKTLLATADGAAANFIGGVANGWIGVEAGLLAARIRGADFGIRLAKRGIGLLRDFLDLLEGNQSAIGFFLRTAKARIHRSHGLDVGVMMLMLRLVLRHLHFLGLRDTAQRCEENQDGEFRLRFHLAASPDFFLAMISSYSRSGSTRIKVIMPIIPALQFCGRP